MDTIIYLVGLVVVPAAAAPLEFPIGCVRALTVVEGMGTAAARPSCSTRINAPQGHLSPSPGHCTVAPDPLAEITTLHPADCHLEV
jgi:hypothetical protein